MMTKNPFDISFGKTPGQSIPRFVQTSEILEAFTADPATQQVYILTGVRGSGKTVLMNSIANDLETEPDWIVARLNPGKDLLLSLGARLCAHKEYTDLFREADINLSLFGVGIGLHTASPAVTDVEITVEQMIRLIRNQHKKLLITIDEVTNSEQMRIFAGAFQIYTGQHLPVYLLMTGLYENIDSLQNEKSLTFLYRAPKIFMTPLNTGAMTAKYKEVFDISYEEALSMAAKTKGYPFAFQALGFSAWRNGTMESAYMTEYRQLLEDYVYEKIWEELSEKEREIVVALTRLPDGKISEINALLQYKPNEINQYRKRLIRKGILEGSVRGYLKFTLPYFNVFLMELMAQ